MSKMQVTKEFLQLAYRGTDDTESDILIDATETFDILRRNYEENVESEVEYKSVMSLLCDVFMTYCRKYCPTYCK